MRRQIVYSLVFYREDGRYRAGVTRWNLQASGPGGGRPLARYEVRLQPPTEEPIRPELWSLLEALRHSL